jgi:hypothetical protein
VDNGATAFQVGTRFALLISRNESKQRMLIIIKFYHQSTKGELIMKKFIVQLIVIGSMIAAYALPVLAGGGGGP